MSESRYYDERIREFRGAHPAHEGWKVYELGAHEAIYFNSVLEFLDARAPGSLTHADCWRSARQTGAKGEKFALRASGWLGQIELQWNGRPVHLLSIRFLIQYRTEPTYAAVKDLSDLEGLCKALRDFNVARRRREESIIVVNGRDLPRPNVSWESVILPKTMTSEIRSAAEGFFKSNGIFKKLGLAYRRGILLAGPPGCGKTMTTKAIAASIQAACVSYVPRSAPSESDRLAEAFTTAEDLAPSILILEDLDKFAVPISQILNSMDGLSAPRGVLVVATTNEPQRLDPALLCRPSRFDRVWHFPLPGPAERRTLLELRGGALFTDDALAEAARLSEGFTMAYVQEILATAATLAVSRDGELRDADLLESVRVLRTQLKAARAAPPTIGGAASVGFAPSAQTQQTKEVS